MHGQVLIFSAIFGTVNLSVSILRLRFPILNFDAVLLCNEIFINKREIVICKIDNKKNPTFSIKFSYAGICEYFCSKIKRASLQYYVHSMRCFYVRQPNLSSSNEYLLQSPADARTESDT